MFINSPSVRPLLLPCIRHAFNRQTVFHARVPDALHCILGDTETGDSAGRIRGLPAKGL